MHTIQPEMFPIFDQHVYRAYTYLITGVAEKLAGTTKQQIALYADYQVFFNLIKYETKLQPRTLDKAFWAFGRFIKQKNMANFLHED